MIQKTFVDFETAETLYNLGFNNDFYFYYRKDENDHPIHHSNMIKPLNKGCKMVDDEVIPCPTIQEAVEWIYTKFNIYITAIPDTSIGFCFITHVCERNANRWVRIYTNTSDNVNPVPACYDNPEDAFNAGIKYVLTNFNLI